MTQDDLAAKLQLRGGDFVRLTINRIENGRREVTDYELVQIADVLGVDLNTLVCGKLTVSEMAKRISDRTLLKEDSGGTEFGQNNNGDENIFAAEGK